jgi:uncharacterized membrane protein
MSYQEKKTIASIISGMLVLAAYCIYVFGINQTITDLKQSAATILIFIGIGIVATIIIQIIFHMVYAASLAIKKGKCDDEEIDSEMKACMVEDEMVKLIELKSSKVGYVIAGIGFVAGLISLVLGVAPVVMLNIFFLSSCGGSLIEGFSGLHYYRKGV